MNQPMDEEQAMELEHRNLVLDLVKPGQDIIASLSPEKTNLWHAATGICGEAGEILDTIKKHVVYDLFLNRENAIEELGDLEFYMEQMRNALHVTRHECLAGNVKKLRIRYGKKYSNEKAAARLDKSETGETEKSGLS